ncbi:carbohydrate-binding protein [Streptomyces profundus]|uniref:carbohydrate-binding protein n=1 Tax=Streptomyces profundus TaxID=2867410 RepID=UPI001D16E69A|nr:carbohydrate-binding protein [Streptomyces sp. MA3_2.13]UED86445.1 alpha-lytic protease prodomain-containing protein [Streptomyces sp. MA3_2.13]
MQRRRGTAIAAVFAAAALIATAAPATAGPTPPTTPPQVSAQEFPETAEAPDLPAALLAALERDLGLSPDEARARIAGEHRAGLVEPLLRAELGTAFAGARVEGPDARLIVATTDAGEVATIEAAGASAEVVDHALVELEAVKAALDETAASHPTAETPVWYVDVTSNSVVLHAGRDAAAQDFLAAADVPAELVDVVPSAEQPRPLYDLRGGEAYYINNSGRCSVGFSVTRGTTPGFATAGHCGRVGASTQGHNRVAQGTFQGSVFPGRDMAWVAVNSNWTPTPQVTSSPVAVAGSTQGVVGASICRSGSTTGWHCGQIQQHNTSVTYPEGTISGVTRTSVCAEPGDSGGSYISGSQAQGVTSGGSGNCRTGGTTYHQPINPLLSQFGLTLVTTGSGPGEPGEPGEPGTWTVGTTYQAGDTVTHGGAEYRCVITHVAQAGWDPVSAPALWQRI